MSNKRELQQQEAASGKPSAKKCLSEKCGHHIQQQDLQRSPADRTGFGCPLKSDLPVGITAVTTGRDDRALVGAGSLVTGPVVVACTPEEVALSIVTEKRTSSGSLAYVTSNPLPPTSVAAAPVGDSLRSVANQPPSETVAHDGFVESVINHGVASMPDEAARAYPLAATRNSCGTPTDHGGHGANFVGSVTRAQRRNNAANNNEATENGDAANERTSPQSPAATGSTAGSRLTAPASTSPAAGGAESSVPTGMPPLVAPEAAADGQNGDLEDSDDHDSQPESAARSSEPPGANEAANNQKNNCCLCWCCCCSCSCKNGNNAQASANHDSNSNGNQQIALVEIWGDQAPPLIEEIQEWGESFDKLMKHPAGRKIFGDFLRCEYSEENILFWQACEELKTETEPDVIEEKARLIYEDFISILSPREVSLDSRVRDVINKNMVAGPTVNTFDEAQMQIYTLMHRDSYPRFVNSPVYRKIGQQPLGGTSAAADTAMVTAKNGSSMT